MGPGTVGTPGTPGLKVHASNSISKGPDLEATKGVKVGERGQAYSVAGASGSASKQYNLEPRFTQVSLPRYIVDTGVFAILGYSTITLLKGAVSGFMESKYYFLATQPKAFESIMSLNSPMMGVSCGIFIAVDSGLQSFLRSASAEEYTTPFAKLARMSISIVATALITSFIGITPTVEVASKVIIAAIAVYSVFLHVMNNYQEARYSVHDRERFVMGPSQTNAGTRKETLTSASRSVVDDADRKIAKATIDDKNKEGEEKAYFGELTVSRAIADCAVVGYLGHKIIEVLQSSIVSFRANKIYWFASEPAVFGKIMNLKSPVMGAACALFVIIDSFARWVLSKLTNFLMEKGFIAPDNSFHRIAAFSLARVTVSVIAAAGITAAVGLGTTAAVATSSAVLATSQVILTALTVYALIQQASSLYNFARYAVWDKHRQMMVEPRNKKPANLAKDKDKDKDKDIALATVLAKDPAVVLV